MFCPSIALLWMTLTDQPPFTVCTMMHQTELLQTSHLIQPPPPLLLLHAASAASNRLAIPSFH